MDDFRKWPRTNARTIINFNRLIERLDTAGDTLICVPVALVDIIRKLLRDRGLWRTTYAKTLDDIGYTIPTESEFKPIEDMISNFLWETSEMRCQDLINALNGIAASISGCCQSSGPGYISDGEGGFWYGTEQPLEKPSSFGGTGEFPSQSEFSEHLCSAANNIVSGLILTLNNWSALSLAGLVAGALIVAFFVTAPPLALFLILAGAGFSFGTMSTISNYIDTNRQDWVCAIFNATSYSEMLASVDDLISDLTVSLDLGAFEVPLTDIIHATLSTDVFNKAYSVIGLPPPIDPIDCDTCADLLVDVVFTRYIAGTNQIVPISPDSIDGDLYTFNNVEAFTVNGVANSILIDFERDEDQGALFSCEVMEWTNYLGTGSTIPREVRGWNAAGTLVLDVFDIITLQDLNDALDPIGNLDRLAIWSVGGPATTITLRIFPT